MIIAPILIFLGAGGFDLFHPPRTLSILSCTFLILAADSTMVASSVSMLVVGVGGLSDSPWQSEVIPDSLMDTSSLSLSSKSGRSERSLKKLTSMSIK